MKAHEVDSARPGPEPVIARGELTHYLLRGVQDGTVFRRPDPADRGSWLVTLLEGWPGGYSMGDPLRRGDYRATEAVRWALSALAASGLVEWEVFTAPWALPGAERAFTTMRGRRLLWRWDVALGLIPGPSDLVAGSTGDGVTDDPVGAPRPRVYAVCGSPRLPDALALAGMHLSSLGHIVIGSGLMGQAGEPRGARFLAGRVPGARERLRFRGIDRADAVYVVNVGGYVGPGTREEIAYAHSAGKTVEWMFPGAGTDPDPAFYAHAGHDDRATPDCPYCP